MRAILLKIASPITDIITTHLNAAIFCLQEAEADIQVIADKLLLNYTKLHNEISDLLSRMLVVKTK
ncbi:hypothetical protein EB118_07515 [bacterium]|nr:hypothetical protein [bacterium]NBX97810.1 hypothetical protein [bacterium]NDC94536.1 hypothetical protein [bacterium]NDD83863.1 hypothetical protein [bacterium]NDG29928.1 hypothetical protein [bacterium]